ncbi:hypothetical protein ACEPAG_5785 [Sanghuangporus baumii]
MQHCFYDFISGAVRGLFRGRIVSVRRGSVPVCAAGVPSATGIVSGAVPGASEASWNQQLEVLNKEIADLTARCKDLTAQNSLLHRHLESVSSQASRIRQTADSSMNVPESGRGDDVNGRVAQLRSVVAYLHKEKESVYLQLELSEQENAPSQAGS